MQRVRGVQIGRSSRRGASGGEFGGSAAEQATQQGDVSVAQGSAYLEDIGENANAYETIGALKGWLESKQKEFDAFLTSGKRRKFVAGVGRRVGRARVLSACPFRNTCRSVDQVLVTDETVSQQHPVLVSVGEYTDN